MSGRLSKQTLQATPQPDEHIRLQADRIVMTAELLAERIEYRLPERSLVRVARTVRGVAAKAVWQARAIQAPNFWLRGISILIVVSMIVVIVKVAGWLRFNTTDAWDMLSGIEAGISTVVYLGLAMIFVVTLETRIRRRKALAAVQELRALAHVIDMHQLSKDPERLGDRYGSGREYAGNTLNPEDLGRYLDYCTDLLSLVGKVAVLYGDNVEDGVVLGAVDEVERLTTGLSQKIWQKIMILDQIIATTSHDTQVGG